MLFPMFLYYSDYRPINICRTVLLCCFRYPQHALYYDLFSVLQRCPKFIIGRETFAYSPLIHPKEDAHLIQDTPKMLTEHT